MTLAASLYEYCFSDLLFSVHFYMKTCLQAYFSIAFSSASYIPHKNVGGPDKESATAYVKQYDRQSMEMTGYYFGTAVKIAGTFLTAQATDSKIHTHTYTF